MKVAFVTCSAVPEGRFDDLLAAGLIGAEVRVWDDARVDWLAYDRVVIRSAWDYTARREEFLAWCAHVGPERLRNRPELITWNSDKRYLGELGIPTVPTTFLTPGDPLAPFVAEIVVKPNISAGARRTGRFRPDARAGAQALADEIHAGGCVALVQPYLGSVDELGETSVVLLGGEVSHVLHKKPVLRDAGVAPLIDNGGPAVVMFDEDLVTVHTAEAVELELAQAALRKVTARFGEPLYLRVDMVWGEEGDPMVMELEAIEPSLYLHLAPGAAERFATTILGG